MAKTHGQAANGGTRTYHKWKNMLQRCTDPNRPDWPRYGGRGIRVCERWHRFENFLSDMGACPDGLTLDRIDTNGNYEPGNTRWATWEQQYASRRSNKGERHGNARLTARDVIMIRRLAERGIDHRSLGRRYGVSHTNIGLIVKRETWQHLPADAPVESGGGSRRHSGAKPPLNLGEPERGGISGIE